jgi:Na+-transporting NADH:ubiquinone oxidoreductase subunit C
MNKESNKYIYIYSIAMVVIVAATLSIAATILKPFQQKKVEVEKKQNILFAVHKAADVKKAKSKKRYIEDEYAKYITSSSVVNSLGTEQEGNAFEVNLEEEMAKPAVERKLPVFICTDDDSTLKYILPVRGAGLWGPIWGYVALHDDFSTIYGVVFDHQGETPGLGAELSTPEFHRQFAGKQIFDAASTFVSVKVVKGGGTQGRPHEVDAISGGTITSQGVEKMLLDNLSAYLNFFKEQQKIKVARQKQAKEEKAAKEQPAIAVRREPRLVPMPPAEAAAATDTSSAAGSETEKSAATENVPAPTAPAADSAASTTTGSENAAHNAPTQQEVQPTEEL